MSGPARKESILVGLGNGNVMKIFIDNSFPIMMIQHSVGIRVVD